MKIIREGKEFELTKEELFEAYLEQEAIYDYSNIKENMEGYLGFEDYDRLKNNEVFIESAAAKLRKKQDEYDMGYDAALDSAFKEAVEEFSSSLSLFEHKAKECILEFFKEENVPFDQDEEKELCSKIRKCAEGYFAGKKSPHGLDSEEQNYACDICGVIEDILEEKDITISDDSREDYEEDEEDQARLFGDAYYEMEDAIASLFEEVKGEFGIKTSLEEQVTVASEGRSGRVCSEKITELDR